MVSSTFSSMTAWAMECHIVLTAVALYRPVGEDVKIYLVSIRFYIDPKHSLDER